jgi:hypothetical protein
MRQSVQSGTGKQSCEKHFFQTGGRQTLMADSRCRTIMRENHRMSVWRLVRVLSVLWFLPVLSAQVRLKDQAKAAIDTTLCKIANDPSAFNNKLVKIRGFVQASSETSTLNDAECPGSQIWFVFADGSFPPAVEAVVAGNANPGSRDPKGRAVAPISVQLVRDSDFVELGHHLALSEKGATCDEGPPTSLPPDCTTYRITATFVGRVDSVSKKVHDARLRRSPRDAIDRNGFGQMGMFDAQIVVQSVEKVLAEDESLFHKIQPKP